MILAIDRNQRVITGATQQPLVAAAATDQQVVPIPALEFLHGAFATHQGIGTTLEVTEARPIIAVEILMTRIPRPNVDAADQAIITFTAIKNLVCPGTAPKNIIIVAAAQSLVRARVAQQTVIAVAAIPFIIAKQGTGPGRDRIIAIIAIEKFNLVSAAIAKQAVITDAA